jgi:hypothetical protein
MVFGGFVRFFWFLVVLVVLDWDGYVIKPHGGMWFYNMGVCGFEVGGMWF